MIASAVAKGKENGKRADNESNDDNDYFTFPANGA
jgi:hypothetical protein